MLVSGMMGMMDGEKMEGLRREDGGRSGERRRKGEWGKRGNDRGRMADKMVGGEKNDGERMAGRTEKRERISKK